MGTLRWGAVTPQRSADLALEIMGYQDVPPASVVHRGLPSGTVTLIVSTGPPIDVGDAPHADPATRSRFRCVVGGLHMQPAYIHRHEPESGIAVAVRPDAVRRLFGMPASALYGSSVELSDVLGRRGDEFVERIAERDDLGAQIAECERQLVAIAQEHDHDTDRRLGHVWRMFEYSGGHAPVASVADRVGWSRQHLGRRFQTEFGVAPKDAARLVRFGEAVGAMKADHRDASLAQIAAHSGYADQAHFTREWREFAGCTPSEWRAEERVPSVQDESTDR